MTIINKNSFDSIAEWTVGILFGLESTVEAIHCDQ
jgi:hypothetical protein